VLGSPDDKLIQRQVHITSLSLEKLNGLIPVPRPVRKKPGYP